MQYLVLIFAFILFGGNFSAAQDIYLDYGLPAEVVKKGPVTLWGGESESYKYFLPGQEPSPQTMVGEDEVRNGKVIKRELFKDGRKHGIQREWYLNGVLRSESPYRDGVKDGLFREWDVCGHLIASYLMRGGTGTVRRFDSDGKIAELGDMKKNRWDGYHASTGERTYSIIRYNVGQIIGLAVSWSSISGKAVSVDSYNGRGRLSGPAIEVGEDGGLLEKKWYFNDEEIKEAEYAKAAAADPDLIPYFSDWHEYLKLIPKEVTELLHLCQTTKVKIPLEFDGQGNPVPAE